MKGIKINYEIDNFSGILKVEDWRFVYSKSKKLHYRDPLKPKPFIPTKISGCYALYDVNKEIIYIGKTFNCVRQRLITHLFNDPSEYSEMSGYNRRHNIKQKQAVFFSYVKIDKQHVSMVEVFLINKYSPKHNVEYKIDLKSSIYTQDEQDDFIFNL